MTFTVPSLLFALLLAILAYVFGFTVVRKPDLWRLLPRERYVGEVVGVVCLVWSAAHVIPMLEGDLARYRAVVKVVVPVAAVLGFFYLDYLFTRALGGLFMLMASQLLHGAFVVHLPARPAYSVVCYAYGVVGMFLVGSPWRFRDLLKRATDSPRWRRWLLVGLGASSALFVVAAFLG